eukprot:364583-Chlamydomonas_euryale.AAC.7
MPWRLKWTAVQRLGCGQHCTGIERTTAPKSCFACKLLMTGRAMINGARIILHAEAARMHHIHA